MLGAHQCSNASTQSSQSSRFDLCECCGVWACGRWPQIHHLGSCTCSTGARCLSMQPSLKLAREKRLSVRSSPLDVCLCVCVVCACGVVLSGKKCGGWFDCGWPDAPPATHTQMHTCITTSHSHTWMPCCACGALPNKTCLPLLSGSCLHGRRTCGGGACEV